jgi:hypothetical protein
MSNIHIKLEQPEAVSIKKNILFVEKDLLETAKHIRVYSSLRRQEFIFKNRLKKDFAILNNLIKSMESELPQEELEMATRVPKGETKIEKKKPASQKQVTEEKKNSIESQLNEIRAKLAQLE